MRKNATVACLAIVGALSGAVVLPAMATTVVIPNVNENQPGPSNQSFPYNLGPMRVQQVFASSQLQGKRGFITQIAFRVDEEVGAPFTSGPIDTEVRLCHTNVVPGAMSSTFADNIGSDVTLVYDGMVALSSDGTGAFDIVIDVNDLFFYDGVQNLLVEYKVFSAAVTAQFDAAGTGLGEGGTPWVDRLWAFDPNAPTGTSDGDDGYVTQLTIEKFPHVAVREKRLAAVQTTTWGRIKSTFVDN